MTKQPIKLENLSLDPEKYYMFFPRHYGDTFSEVGFLHWFETTVGGEVVCLIRPEQEIIMRLFGRDEYEIIDFDYNETPTYRARLAELSRLCPVPQKGVIFVGLAADAHLELRHMGVRPKNTLEQIALLFRAPFPPPLSAFQMPTDKYLSASRAFMDKIAAIGPLEEIVLLSPISFSYNPPGWEEFARPFWEKQAREWSKMGYKVVVSSVRPIEFEGAVHVPMTMEEAIWLGIHCHYVVARRSGYMDILACLRDTATIVYSSYEAYVVGNFLDRFNKRFREIIMPDVAEKAKADKAASENKKKEAERRDAEKRKEEEFFHKIDARFEKLKVEIFALISEQAGVLKKMNGEMRDEVNARFEKLKVEIFALTSEQAEMPKKMNEEMRDEVNARGEELRGGIFALSAMHLKMIKDWQRDMRDTSTKIYDGVREVILSPLTWLNLQRCRLGSHLFFGRLGQHYGTKKRRLRARILKGRGFLNGTVFKRR